MFSVGGLFEGYGGLTLAVQAVLGRVNLAWYSEYEPPSEATPHPRQAAARLLAHHHPGVPNLGDITRVDWSTIAPVDILTGGSPCQDLSSAGPRRGMHAGTRSGLWEPMREAIAVLRPRLVVWENVRGATSGCVHSELGDCPRCVGGAGRHRPVLRALGRVLGDLADLGFDAEWHGLPASSVGAPHERFRLFVVAWPADADVLSDLPEMVPGAAADADRDERVRQPGEQPRRAAAARHSCDAACQRDRDWRVVRSGRLIDYGAAIRRWHDLTRCVPSPTEPNSKGGRRLAPAFSEWMMGLPAGHVTDPELGLTRAEQLRILGNGVVPQQGAAAVRRCLARAASG